MEWDVNAGDQHKRLLAARFTRTAGRILLKRFQSGNSPCYRILGACKVIVNDLQEFTRLA